MGCSAPTVRLVGTRSSLGDSLIVFPCALVPDDGGACDNERPGAEGWPLFGDGETTKTVDIRSASGARVMRLSLSWPSVWSTTLDVDTGGDRVALSVNLEEMARRIVLSCEPTAACTVTFDGDGR